jgi:hypothetical protein
VSWLSAFLSVLIGVHPWLDFFQLPLLGAIRPLSTINSNGNHQSEPQPPI